ncbi:MAG: flagellar export protein FliJ [Ideonella sp.]|nr:flagellar export protein FliJ [Ideonella sp.]MCC7455354.1 flagellar export protein FliJ [Nitrospira sp.]
MPTLEALNQLLDHERRTRDEALLGLRDAETTRDTADSQAAQLDAYRGETVQRWSTRFREPGSVALMQCYQGFMQRLDQAIGQQQAAVRVAHQQFDQAQAVLREVERRVASVEKLIERRSQQLQRRQARREQVLSDEIALRLHTRRQADSRHGADPTP